MFGLVVSDNPAFVTVDYNLIQGRFQHGILITTGTTAARVRLWNNTVQQTGRSTSSGNASAVFIVSAAQVDARNNLFAYTNPDLLGSAFLLNDESLVGSFTANANWYASPDPNALRVAWNGARVSFASWRALSGQDSASFTSAPPSFSADGRVTSANLGAGKGVALGLAHDLVGTRAAGARSRHRRVPAHDVRTGFKSGGAFGGLESSCGLVVGRSAWLKAREVARQPDLRRPCARS